MTGWIVGLVAAAIVVVILLAFMLHVVEQYEKGVAGK